jgi:sterol desaturase/sphingolipid hydroxylase (fatty acid hydroxylase superfamily)
MSGLELVAWICAAIMFGAFAIEGLVSYFILKDGRHELGDSFLNIGLAIGYVIARLVIGAGVTVALMAVYELTPLRWSMDAWWHWGVLFLVEDFFYYWSHRASHVYRFMWISHVTHHSSPVMNLSTGLRNSWIGGAIDWVFFIPPVALGFHPLALAAVIGVASAIDFLTHTPYVGKLPVLDWIFNTPSNHRVHHALNPRYLDKNLGGALIIWDRLFGTYAAEDATDPPRYGVEPPPARRYNPFYLEFHLWIDYLRDLFRRRRPTA